MFIGSREFCIGKHTYIAGILNVTPDSFSDGGQFNDMDKCLFRVEEMAAAGADIIDIGGESSRPGAVPVDACTETDRVVPVIEAVRRRFDIPVSLDTCKASVAAAGIAAGADMINDIRGLKGDPDMAEVIASSQAACCLMHNRTDNNYVNLIDDIIHELTESVELARTAGIDDNRIVIDPGIGFAKNTEQNLQVLNALDSFTDLGFPVLLGTSRKSVIGTVLDLPTDKRLEGTLATTVMAVLKGVSFVRVHDVEANARAIRMTEAVRDAGNGRITRN